MYRTVADAALIEAAQRIAPRVRACRDEGERERRLPAPVLAAMHEARLFRMYIPKALDGLEIDPITPMIVVEEIAHADAAAAWNLMLGATYGLWAAFLLEDAVREIYGAPDAVVAGALRPSVRARPVDGGAKGADLGGLEGAHGAWHHGPGSRLYAELP
jgi:indole-3-acetate monooxygenase